VNLGEEIKSIREQSPYRDLRSFSYQAGLSHEGLRKIEHGIRLPNRPTLDRILEVGKVPSKRANELRKSRDQAQAVRAGLVSSQDPDVRLQQLTGQLMKTLKKFFVESNCELPKREETMLYKRIEAILRKEICV